MISHPMLPDGYNEIKKISFTENKKFSVIINIAALIVGIIMVVPMLFIVPFDALFRISSDGDLNMLIVRMAVLAVSEYLYVIMHEAIHGVFIRIISGKWGKFGFKSVYAYASCDTYIGKKEYIIIALAPILIFGILLGVLSVFVSAEWFWIVYIIQITNISGAVGDVYVTYAMTRLPKDTLVFDTGLEMTVFSKETPMNDKTDDQKG